MSTPGASVGDPQGSYLAVPSHPDGMTGTLPTPSGYGGNPQNIPASSLPQPAPALRPFRASLVNLIPPLQPSITNPAIVTPELACSPAFIQQNLPIPVFDGHQWIVVNMEWLQQNQSQLHHTPDGVLTVSRSTSTPPPACPPLLSPLNAASSVDPAMLQQALKVLPFQPSIEHTVSPTWSQQGYLPHEIEDGRVVQTAGVSLPFPSSSMDLLQNVFFFGPLNILPLTESNYNEYFVPFFPSYHLQWNFWTTIILLYSILSQLQSQTQAGQPINWLLVSQHPVLTLLQRSPQSCQQHYNLLCTLSSMHAGAATLFVNRCDPSIFNQAQQLAHQYNRLLLVPTSFITNHDPASKKTPIQRITETFSIAASSTSVTTMVAFDYTAKNIYGYTIAGCTDFNVNSTQKEVVPLSQLYADDLARLVHSPPAPAAVPPLQQQQQPQQHGYPPSTDQGAGFGTLPADHHELPPATTTRGGKPSRARGGRAKYDMDYDSYDDDDDDHDDGDDDDDDDDEYDDDEENYGRRRGSKGNRGGAKARNGSGGSGRRRTGGGNRPSSRRAVTDVGIPGERSAAASSSTRTSARRLEQMHQQQQQQQQYDAMVEETMANMPRRRSTRAPVPAGDEFDYTPPPRKQPTKKAPTRMSDDYDGDGSTSSSSDEEISYSDDDDGGGNYYHTNQRKLKKMSNLNRSRAKSMPGLNSSRITNNHANAHPTPVKGTHRKHDDDGDAADDEGYGDDDDDDDDYDDDEHDDDEDGYTETGKPDDGSRVLEQYLATLTPAELNLYHQQQHFEEERKKIAQPRIEKILAVREVKKQLKFSINGEVAPVHDMYYDTATNEIVIPDHAPLVHQQKVDEYQRYLDRQKESTEAAADLKPSGQGQQGASPQEVKPDVSSSHTTDTPSSPQTTPPATTTDTDAPFPPLVQPPPGLTFDQFHQWNQDQDDEDAYTVYYNELLECVQDFFLPSVDDYTIMGHHYDISIQFEQEPDSEAEPLDYEAIANMSQFQYQAYVDLREQKRLERQKMKQEKRRLQALEQAKLAEQQQQQIQPPPQQQAQSHLKTEDTATTSEQGSSTSIKQEQKDALSSTTPTPSSLSSSVSPIVDVKTESFTIPDTYCSIPLLPSKIVRLEYLVKPLNVSYRHIQWLSPTGLMKVYGKRHAQDRVKRFLLKREETENYNLDKFGGEHFDSKFINIDRILSQRVVLLNRQQLQEMKKTIDDVKGVVIPPFHSVCLMSTGELTVFPTPKPVLDAHVIPENVLALKHITPVNPNVEPRQLVFSQELLNRLTDEQHTLFGQLENQYETQFFAHNVSDFTIHPKYSKQTYDGSDAEGAWDEDDDGYASKRGTSKAQSLSSPGNPLPMSLKPTQTPGTPAPAPAPAPGDGTTPSSAQAHATSETGQTPSNEPSNAIHPLVDPNLPFIPPCEEKIAVIEYLIKWNGLGYTQATWEPRYQLNHDVNEIKRFLHYNRELTRLDKAPKVYSEQDQFVRQQRASKWYQESPKYKNDMELRPYQVEGVNWLIELFIKKQNGILADEMGLGKTVQCVAFLEHLYNEENLHGPFLVVTPLSTLNNWKRESDLWTTQNVVIYHDATGGSAGRDTLRKYEFYSSFYPQVYDKVDIQQQVLQASQQRDEFGNPYPYPPGVVASFDGMSYEVHHGRSAKGAEMQRAQTESEAINTLLPVKYNILITSYEMMMSDVAYLRTIPFQYVIIDEGHKLKNQNAKLADAFKELQIDRKLLLTGTPIQNNTNELFALLHFIHPDVFSNRERFLEKFGELNDASQVAELQKTISPYLLRRMKETVEKSIPNKEETIIDVELTTLQKIYYRAIYERNLKFLKQGGTGQNAPKLINIEAELRKCCNHPWLVRGVEEKEVPPGASEEEYYNATIQASGKLVLLDKLLPKLYEDGHRVLIFSQMVTLLDIISEYLKYRKYKFERLDGNVTGDQRDAAIDRFCRPDSDRFIFLLSTRAGGVGLNLTSADTVIIYDSDWNPQQDVQAQARAHRIGQKNNVLVYRLITRNTYESEMFNRASKKLGLDFAVLKRLEKGSKRQQEATASEIDKILRLGAYGMLDEDDEQRQAFFNSNIEDILKNNSRVISTGNTNTPNPNTTGVVDFQKQYFSSESSDKAKLDINDANFWSHILGNDDEYKCQPEVLQTRLNDIATLRNDPEQATEFFNNISKLMYNTFERIKATKEEGDSNSMVDGEDEDGTVIVSTPAANNITTPGATPAAKPLGLEEVDELIALLIQFTSTTDVFTDEQLTKGQVWLGELEMRTSRRKNHINYRSVNLYNDNDNSVQHNRSSRGKLFNKRLRQQYGNGDDEEDIYNYNSDDEENIDPLKRRVPPVNFHETDRGIEYTDRAGINNDIQLVIPKRGRGARPIYNVAVCSVCYCPGELLACDGPCQRLMHVECMPKGIPKYGTPSRKDNIFHRLLSPPNQLLSSIESVNETIREYNAELIKNTRDYAKKYKDHPKAPSIIQGDKVLVEGLIQPLDENSNEDFIRPNGQVVMPSLLDSKKPWVCIECQEQTWRCFGCDHAVTTRPTSILGRLMKIAVAKLDKLGEESGAEGSSSGSASSAQKRKKQNASNSRDHDVRFCSVANCGRVAHLGCARSNRHNHFYGKTEVLSAYRCSIHFCAVCARNEEREQSKTEEEKQQDMEKKRVKHEKRIYVDGDDEDEEGEDTGGDTKRGAKVSENSMILCISCSSGYHTRCMPVNATRLARKSMLCVECTKVAFTNSLGRRVIAFSQNPFTMKILRDRVKIKYNPGGDNSHINQFTPKTVTKSTFTSTPDVPPVKKGGSTQAAPQAASASGSAPAPPVNAASNPLNVYPTFSLLVDIDGKGDHIQFTPSGPKLKGEGGEQDA